MDKYNYKFDKENKTITILPINPQEATFALKALIEDGVINPTQYKKAIFHKKNSTVYFKIIDEYYESEYSTLVFPKFFIGKAYYIDYPVVIVPNVYSCSEYAIRILEILHFNLTQSIKDTLPTNDFIKPEDMYHVEIRSDGSVKWE